jgi:hypothetical protein
MVAFCALGSVGTLYAHSAGITNPAADSALFATVGARVGLEWPLSRALVLRAHLDAAADLRRGHLQIGAVDAWTVPLVGGAAGAGLVAYFE